MQRNLQRTLGAPSRFRQAFTIVELLVVVGILAVLTGLLLGNWDRIVASAEQAKCASHMRAIRVALDNYLQDHSVVWPQGPEPRAPDWAPFWIRTLAPYDIPPSTWQCPTIRRLTRGDSGDELSLHYIPTTFGAEPRLALRWPTHPWLIEIGDAHGRGPLICFPDGSIKPLSRVLAEQGTP